MHAPAFVDTPETKAALLRLPDVAGVVSRYAELAVAIVGIGAFGDEAGGASSSLIRSGALSAPEARRLVRQGAGADLLVHPFTATGRFLAPDLAARALAIGIDDLRRIPSVVAVASGAAKVPAIRGALATRVPGVLVTSAATARDLLA
jgi:DNA-binding transcriptional regulator LsrR (DeoR family)